MDNTPELREGDIIKRVDGNLEEHGYVMGMVPDGIMVEFIGKTNRKGTPGIWKGGYELISRITGENSDS